MIGALFQRLCAWWLGPIPVDGEDEAEADDSPDFAHAVAEAERTAPPEPLED